MKHLILIGALLIGGCATVDQNGDTPHQAEVRAWLTSELVRISDKRNIVNDMLKTGQISTYEHFLLIQECDNEKRTILDRLPNHLR